ncbi:threonine--tRNA ligase [Wenzhouxiangella limi]|uniref:Threonine--tRNA ligase n=1 Tax=Wenzhouxiangella limi TaxID=2707351 RepID=A0A845UVT8_9GAMM|nr:threonine--tRNA ligase [Wenzhouxiangella limi]NDY94708.1 threonine--tRNA ligase [Wenzhouxiangella limi]
MVQINLPDGSSKRFDGPVTVADVAASIGSGLAKATLAGEVDGRLVDANHCLESDASVRIITARDEEGLDLIRHSTAHLMAQAVKRLFPETQVTIGPVIENGFYYDFAREEPFRPEDLEAIEAEMQRIVADDLPVSREIMDRDEAVEFFRDQGEEYKARIIADIPAGETISLYRQGDFIDLCRGPHIPSTGKLGAFKLTKLAGAYWRGDAGNEMLQRIYGTAWADKKQLKAFLKRLEEAEKRDHRRLGKQLDLFRFQDDAPGAVFWLPRGWALFRQLIDYMRQRQEAAGYVEVNTPDVMDRSLWETSGHWQNYHQHMFTTKTEDDRVFALKPMNCPGSVSLYKHGLKSYRDLPIRMAEFGKVHRYEPSGALHGLMRVRHFTQDDAHIYCTEEQMEEECRKVIELNLSVYKDFGFDDVRLKFADRPENRIGDDATWDKLEGALKGAIDAMGLDYTYNPGEGAFYGPKIEFVLRDAIGRDWQCGTLQVDLNLPERFDATYRTADGGEARPVMLHRALFGSLERFTGILIEHYSGNLPLWLAPVQAVVMNITDAQADYAQDVCERLRESGLRVESDLRNEKVGYKIRGRTLEKIPYLLIVGDREVERGQVAVRLRDGTDLGSMSVEALVERLHAEVAQRGVIGDNSPSA